MCPKVSPVGIVSLVTAVTAQGALSLVLGSLTQAAMWLLTLGSLTQAAMWLLTLFFQVFVSCAVGFCRLLCSSLLFSTSGGVCASRLRQLGWCGTLCASCDGRGGLGLKTAWWGVSCSPEQSALNSLVCAALAGVQSWPIRRCHRRLLPTGLWLLIGYA
jgi:hypothetical protein